MPIDVMSDCPKNVKIEGAQNGSTVDQGTELKCVGDGHPPPSYLWTNAVDNTTVEGDTFTVGMSYHELTCTATTNISFANGTIHTCSDQVYFEVNGRSLCITYLLKSFTQMHVSNFSIYNQLPPLSKPMVTDYWPAWRRYVADKSATATNRW